MKNLLKIWFAICALLLLACNGKKVDNEKKNIVCGVTRWENGRLKSEGCFINDSIKEGLFKRYYQSGKLEYEINYHENKEDGLWIKYFENGTKQFAFNYKNGIRSGVSVEYDENGKLKFFQVYKIFNHNDHPGFGIDFLPNGNTKKIHGSPVIDRLVNKDTLFVGDTLKILFQVAVPNNSKVLLHFHENIATKENGQELKVNEEGIAKYEKVLRQKGIMNWGGDYFIELENKERINFDFKGVSVVR